MVASLKYVHINPTKKYRKLFFKKTDLLNLLQYCKCIEFCSPIGELFLYIDNIYSFQESSRTVLSTNFLKNGIDSQILQRSACAHTLEETCQWIGYCTPSLTNFLFWRNYFSCFEEWEQKTNKENIIYLASGRMMKNQEIKSCATACDSTGKFC